MLSRTRILLAASLVLAPQAAQAQRSHAPAAAPAPAKSATVFFLEDAGGTQWCGFRVEARWRGELARQPARVFGTLTYTGDELSRIDLAETDGSGAWAINDHYLLDAKGQISKLTRLTNVAAADQSIARTYAIAADGAFHATAVSAKTLSTGVAMLTPKPLSFEEPPVATTVRMLPFAVLLGHAGLRTSERFCVPARTPAGPPLPTLDLPHTPQPPQPASGSGLPATPEPSPKP